MILILIKLCKNIEYNLMYKWNIIFGKWNRSLMFLHSSNFLNDFNSIYEKNKTEIFIKIIIFLHKIMILSINYVAKIIGHFSNSSY